VGEIDRTRIEARIEAFRAERPGEACLLDKTNPWDKTNP
jgi:hypothetical protein